MRLTYTLAFGLMSSLVLNVAAQPNVSSLIDSSLKKKINEIITSDLVIQSIENQNERLKDLSQYDVEALDQEWRKQTKADDKYLIAATLSNPLSAYLTRVQAHSTGQFLEIFVMDNKGLNVGQSAVSSDYWQGDEAKWQKTFLKGKGAIFVDQPEYYSDRKVWAAQYNIAIANKQGQPIGAMTVELNLTELERLKGGQ